MLRLATKYDLPAYGAIGSFWLGATQAMHGDLTGGLGQMEPAFEPLHGIGLFALLPAVVMAETLAHVGRDRDALALIARLLGEMSDPQMGMFVSELWRIRGELVARERGGDTALAERSLQAALRAGCGSHCGDPASHPQVVRTPRACAPPAATAAGRRPKTGCRRQNPL